MREKWFGEIANAAGCWFRFVFLLVPVFSFGVGFSTEVLAEPPECVTNCLICTDQCSFSGYSPPVSGSTGALFLTDNVELNQVFKWESSDPILNQIGTGWIKAITWNLIGTAGSPKRLVFTGSGDGATIYGNVLFEPYNRAAIDVVREGRVRYLLELCGPALKVPAARNNGSVVALAATNNTRAMAITLQKRRTLTASNPLSIMSTHR